jgi:hypothetical protein
LARKSDLLRTQRRLLQQKHTATKVKFSARVFQEQFGSGIYRGVLKDYNCIII